MRPEVLCWRWFCQDDFIYSVKGASPLSAQFNTLREVWLPHLERDAWCAQSLLTADFSLGVSCMPFFSHGCDIVVAGTSGTSRTEQRSEGRQGAGAAFAPVPPRCLPVFSGLCHDVQGPSAVAPCRRGRGLLHSLDSSRRFVFPRPQGQGRWALFATSMAPNTAVCDWQGRAGHQAVVTPGLLDYLFLRSKTPSLCVAHS